MIRQASLVLLVLFAAPACQRGQSPQAPLAQAAAADRIPLGAPPGEPVSAAAAIVNPFEGQVDAAVQGQRLFSQMNCVYCHGAGGSGLIGPPLDGHGWRYGGAPAQLFASIHDGRPQGMPAWGGRLPEEQIWDLVSYLETLGGAAPPATAAMTHVLPPTPSPTGPQPNGQATSDAAAQGQKASNAEPER